MKSLLTKSENFAETQLPTLQNIKLFTMSIKPDVFKYLINYYSNKINGFIGGYLHRH